MEVMGYLGYIVISQQGTAMAVGKRLRDADGRFLQPPGAHILPAEGAAPRHPEAVDWVSTLATPSAPPLASLLSPLGTHL